MNAHSDSTTNVNLCVCVCARVRSGVCGVAWRCVSVRADEPGGGALLHHCRTHHSPPLGHTQLPTMPLGEQLLPLPPADVSAPPSGLIARLSPHLAEELKVEGEGGVMDTEQVRRPRRKRVGPPIRYLLESEEQSHGLSATNHSIARGAKVKMKPGRPRTEHQEEEEERRGEVELCQVRPQVSGSSDSPSSDEDFRQTSGQLFTRVRHRQPQ